MMGASRRGNDLFHFRASFQEAIFHAIFRLRLTKGARKRHPIECWALRAAEGFFHSARPSIFACIAAEGFFLYNDMDSGLPSPVNERDSFRFGTLQKWTFGERIYEEPMHYDFSGF